MDVQLMLEQRLTRDKALIDKWSYMVESLGEGSAGSVATQMTVARLLENQDAQLKLMEATVSGDVAQFKKYAYPLIRRIYPTLAINDLVAIQPLEGPVGQIFTFQAKYASNKGTTASGTTVYNNVDKNYSSAIIETEEYRAAAGASTDYGGTLAWFPVIAGSVTIVVDPDGTPITGTDTDNGDGTGTISGAGIASGTVTYATGVVALTLDAVNTEKAVATYRYNNEGNTQIPELDFEITSRAVQVADRVLRAKWTPQALQDMMAVHGVEGDKAFTDEMARAVQREISRTVIDDVSDNASATGTTWSKARPDYISYDDHKRTLVDALVVVSNNIYSACLRGTGNVIVVGANAANVIETLPTFRADSAEALQQPNGRIGILNNRWIVIKDINYGADLILVGYKGTGFLEAGAVFSPYALTLTDALLNPDDMKIRKGLLSRDAFTRVNNAHYGKVTLT